MIGKIPKEHQMTNFEVAVERFIDMNHKLVLLPNQIDLPVVDSEFTDYYCADTAARAIRSEIVLTELILSEQVNAMRTNLKNQVFLAKMQNTQ